MQELVNKKIIHFHKVFRTNKSLLNIKENQDKLMVSNLMDLMRPENLFQILMDNMMKENDFTF